VIGEVVAVTCDQAGDVRAVPVPVVGVRGGRVDDSRRHDAGSGAARRAEVAQAAGDAGVDHRDADALAAVAVVPGLVGPDRVVVGRAQVVVLDRVLGPCDPGVHRDGTYAVLRRQLDRLGGRHGGGEAVDQAHLTGDVATVRADQAANRSRV